ncbi:class II fructose-bisphosphate aldolase [Halalkalibacter alkalisediminis]|uniref:Class II fructose-bisphosphate aldolase n=1 Tax=Halalkalibacter alkalisediminis TaxID=935616 RepID=A0ABV6NEK7_9BACI
MTFSHRIAISFSRLANVSQNLADPEEAIYFWNETKVDALAMAVGSAHGMYKKTPNIMLRQY